MSALPQTLLAFIAALGLLIVVHELGHYWVARWCGVKVLRFSLGFGRVLWSRRFGPDQTEWALAAIPFGGYVSMLDEQNAEPDTVIAAQDLPRAFNRQSVWKRIAIVIAGPVANFLLAIGLYLFLNLAGVEEPRARLAAPTASSLAAQAGLQAGDEIVAIAAQPVQSWVDARWRLLQAAIDRRTVDVDVMSQRGERRVVSVNFAEWPSADIEADFLDRVGLKPHPGRVVIGAIEPNGPGDQAGLRKGDVALAVNDQAIADAAQLVASIRAAAGQSLRLTIERHHERLAVTLVPEAKLLEAKAGQPPQTFGRVGVAIGEKMDSVRVVYGPVEALAQASLRTWETSILSLRMLGKMLVGEVSIKNLSGPITIADYAGQTARIGVDAYIGFLALISISLGVLNLLPIPMLDGGHLMYYAIELIKGKPLSQRLIAVSQRAGFSVLIMLMAVALFNDLTRLFT